MFTTRCLAGCMLVAWLSVGASCCSCPDAATWDRLLPTDSPDHAVGRFCAHLEFGDWRSAYERLSSSTREQMSYELFRVGTPFAEDPRSGVAILDIILDGCATREWLRPLRDGEERVQITYWGEDEDGRPVGYIVHLVLVDERAEESERPDWKLDLIRTVERIPQ